MADLNSFSPIQHQKINETEPRGILINKTNTANTTNQYNYQRPKTDLPAATTAPHPPAPVMPQPAAAIPKPFRARSASVQSQKSVGDGAADDDRNPANPLLREHPRKTVVAFGRTTKVEDTIKGVRATTLPYKPPVGSTKDIMDLRKIVEIQSTQLLSQQEEIQELKSEIHTQHAKYCFLLDSNSKLWSHLNNLEKRISSATEESPMKYDHLMAKEIPKENINHSDIGDAYQPKDSIVVKKDREKNVEKEQKKLKSKSNDEERQLVPAQSIIKLAPELNAVSAVERYLNANPNRAKEIEKIAKELQRKKQHQKSEESEEEDTIDTRRKKEQRKGGHSHHRNHHHHDNSDGGVVEEKITLQRTIYQKPKNVRDYLSSTIDDSLQKYGILTSTIQDRNHHHHNRRRSPTTPTIHEVTSSSASSSFGSDKYVEEPRKLSPERRRPRRRGEKSDSDAENRRLPTINATNMPDHFDDDDMSSDTPEPQPPRRERRQRVAERFKDRRR